MSEEDVMRPVALPVTATAQDPTAKLFASADVRRVMTSVGHHILFDIVTTLYREYCSTYLYLYRTVPSPNTLLFTGDTTPAIDRC